MSDIFVFDVETPNGHNDRICSMGITQIKDGTIKTVEHIFINPETDFSPINISIHGITPNHVKTSPTFPIVWEKIKPLFKQSIIVAHNAVFDLNVLKKTLFHYGIHTTPASYICTLVLSHSLPCKLPNYKLISLCDHFSIEHTQQHQAASDSQYCAQVLLRMIDEHHINIEDYINMFDFDENDRPSSHSHQIKSSDNTRSLQLLQGLLMGVTCDNILSSDEVLAIDTWLFENQHLSGQYPYNKVTAMIQSALEDGHLEQRELEDLLSLFKEILNPHISNECTRDNLNISGKQICLTGDFECNSRPAIQQQLCKLGAICQNTVTRTTDILIVGGQGSDKWAYGNYGLKVKKAIEFQSQNIPIIIISEKDFLKTMEVSL